MYTQGVPTTLSEQLVKRSKLGWMDGGMTERNRVLWGHTMKDQQSAVFSLAQMQGGARLVAKLIDPSGSSFKADGPGEP